MEPTEGSTTPLPLLVDPFAVGAAAVVDVDAMAAKYLSSRSEGPADREELVVSDGES